MFIRSSVTRALGAGLAAVAAFAAATPACAILVQPVVIRMTSTGLHASAAITVVNDRNRPDTVEVTIAELALPQSGPPVLTKIPGNDFLVFPPIATVQPGQTQVFRIRWVGDPVLKQAQTYMFTTSEVPVDQTKGSGVQLVYAIQSLVTVSSPDLKSDISAEGAARASHSFPGNDGQPARTETGLTATFVNAGNDIAFLSDYAIHVEVAGAKPWSLTIPSAEVSKYVGLGLLAPNSKRDLFLAVPDLPASGAITISFKRDTLR